MAQGQSYDVVIVGGSAAGLRAAIALAEEGLRVGVFERQRQIGMPERTWIVTPEIDQVLGFSAAAAVVHRTGIMDLAAGEVRTHVTLTPPDLIVERARLIPLLARVAEAVGVDLWLGEGVQEVRGAPDGLEVQLGDNGRPGRRVRARHLVGADGVASLVGRSFGMRGAPAVPVLQAKVRLPHGYDPQVTRVWFEPEQTRFFSWLIPESPDSGVAGLIAERAAGSRVLLDELLNRHGLRPLSYQGAMIPLYHARRLERRVGASRVLLVGDAAGHVKVTTVGGLVSGLWGATAAARSLIRERPYARELAALNRELRIHAGLRWMLDRFVTEDYERLLSSVNGRVRAFLERRNRDSMAGAAWQLAVAQPKLGLVVLRALLRHSRGSPGRPVIRRTVTAEESE